DLVRHRHGDKEPPRGLDRFLGRAFFGKALAALFWGASFGSGGVTAVHAASIGDDKHRPYGWSADRRGRVSLSADMTTNDGGQAMAVAFLGPRGTYSEEATIM